MNRLLLSLIALFAASSHAFVPPSRSLVSPGVVTSTPPALMEYAPAALVRQRKSVAPVQTMGLFGLGVPEIGVILVAAAFLLGPQKLAELGKDAGKIAGELKEVPKEFQKGLEEGEAQARALKEEVVEKKTEGTSE